MADPTSAEWFWWWDADVLVAVHSVFRIRRLEVRGCGQIFHSTLCAGRSCTTANHFSFFVRGEGMTDGCCSNPNGNRRQSSSHTNDEQGEESKKSIQLDDRDNSY